MKTMQFATARMTRQRRRGSTLVIVIALLGLLAFLGMMFYTFAVQERASAEYFSEAAKASVDDPPNVWDHMLRQVINGPTNRPSDRPSILRSPDRRHSLVANLVGSDITPFTGEAIRVTYSTAGLPIVDQNQDGVADSVDWLDFVDSPAARLGNENRTVASPAPDVDYTYPDINNLFLAYKGFAIRDNDPTNSLGLNPRFEQVPIIIPSFFRPAYLKSGATNGPAGSDVPTDINWASSFDGTNRPTAKFETRSFRPSPLHIAGFASNQTTPVYRYLTDAEATTFGVASGGFPFLPENDTNASGTSVRGELGVWTGSSPSVYELDADNDGDGIREGIWLDLHFPMQEHTDSGGNVRKYVVLHSVTIYDLDSLIDVNVHGNLAGLNRSMNIQTLASANGLSQAWLSRSNLGLGPNEVNPLWALRRGVPAAAHPSMAQFDAHFSKQPINDLEQANMEWIWLLTGRGSWNVTDSKWDTVYAGRWGETERLYNSISSTHLVADLPRPGRAGDAHQAINAGSGVRFGGNLTSAGRNGFDDNQDRYDGELNTSQARIRPFGHPMDFAGTGYQTQGRAGTYTYNVALGSGTFETSNTVTSALPYNFPANDPRIPWLYQDATPLGPSQWPRYDGYSMVREVSATPFRYIYGKDGAYLGAADDDLLINPSLDPLFEDPLETIFDVDFAQRQFDQVFGSQDLLALHLESIDLGVPEVQATGLRLQSLAPYAFEGASTVRDRFTTLSNDLRRFMMPDDLGPDRRYNTADDGPRAWEFTADSDGADNNNDGFGDGDGFLEFPPVFGTKTRPYTVQPYGTTDPFRPQVRRLLTVEAGENRLAIGQLPLSINHILDVERNTQTPAEGTRQFLQYMQRAGMRFRPLVEHPDGSEGDPVLKATTLPVWSASSPVQFPPKTPEEREYWARRDRQKLARDIYVLLYTIGGAGIDTTTPANQRNLRDYTTTNDPSAAEGTSLYTHEQLRHMAQLAVNMVDAMDTDDIVTKFEYDKILGGTGNGWNLDDDAWTDDGFTAYPVGDASFDPLATANGLYPEDSVERGVVFGVEAQQLAFSEVQGIRSKVVAGGHDSTPFDDSVMDRDFCYIELQNMLPRTVELGTPATVAAPTAIWRLARYDRPAKASPIKAPESPDKAIALLQHVDNEIDGGGRFSIAAASDPALATASFFLDLGDVASGSFDSVYELLVPNVAGATLPTSLNQSGSTDPAYVEPLCDLDVIHANHNTSPASRFVALGGGFLDGVLGYDGNDVFDQVGTEVPVVGGQPDDLNGSFTGQTGTQEGGFDLVLQRRLNPHMPSLNETDNPWIEVDRVPLVFQKMELLPADAPAQIYDASGPTGHVTTFRSSERREPLADDTRTTTGASSVAYRYNTIKGGLVSPKPDVDGVNLANAGASFQLWQPHFDREYASSADLLTLPVFGPNLLTQRLNRSRYAPYHQAFPDPANPTSTPDLTLISSAAAMFLRPNFPNQTGETLAVNSSRDNRWYRLFEFVEVPSRVHRMLGNYLTLDRVPGKININMVRHREVYAGLIDNPLFADVPPQTDNTPASPPPNPPAPNGFKDGPFLTAQPSQPLISGGRDLWHELINDRDGNTVKGYDPVTSARKDFWLPGTPNSQPFRSFSHRGSMKVGATATEELVGDDGSQATLLRRIAVDFDDDQDGTADDGTGIDDNGVAIAQVTATSDNVATNRLLLEVGTQTFHQNPAASTTNVQKYQVLSKILNNTTTVSNTFIVYATAAYFEAYDKDPSGLIRVGGRFDLNGDADPKNDQQRAVFIIDRTEAFKAYDPGTGDFDWRRLIKHRATIQ